MVKEENKVNPLCLFHSEECTNGTKPKALSTKSIERLDCHLLGLDQDKGTLLICLDV